MPKGISFIPSSSGKRSRKDDRDIEYSEGERLDARPEPRKPEPEKPLPKKKSSGFSAWLAGRKKEEGKHEEVKAAAREPKVPEFTPGDNVMQVPTTDLLQGDIYQDEEADRKRRQEELRRLQAMQSRGKQSASVEEFHQAPHADPAPPAIHEGEVMAMDQSPDLLDAKPFVAEHPNDMPSVEKHVDAPKSAPRPEENPAPPVAPPAPTAEPKAKPPKKKKERKKRVKKEKKAKPPKKKKEKEPKAQKTPSVEKPTGDLPVVPVATGGKMHDIPNDSDDTVRLDVNLLPDSVLEELESRNRVQDLLLVAVASAVVVFAGYGVMKWYQNELNVDINETEQQVAQVESKITSYDELQVDAADLDEELLSLQEVLDQHIYWTPFLDFLEAHTLPTVYYQSLSGSSSTGSFTLSSVALDYSQIDPQARVLRASDMVDSVTITSAAQHTQSAGASETAPLSVSDDDAKTYVQFTMTIQFSPTLFRHHRAQKISTDTSPS